MAARFLNSPVVKLLPDGRNIQLINDMTFIDEAGTNWLVPADSVVDGASIPRPFWSLIGGPLEGKYRDASIVHDFYCDRRTRTWEATHRVFYEAMIVSGVETSKAKIMFFAVWWMGPRWEERVSINNRLRSDSLMHFVTIKNLTDTNAAVEMVTLNSPSKNVNAENYAEIIKAAQNLIETQDISLDEIERIAEDPATKM
jgi:Protein of unknown function (DUF1353)